MAIKYIPIPMASPIVDVAHKIAAEESPVIVLFCLKITAAPKNPIPVIAPANMEKA